LPFASSSIVRSPGCKRERRARSKAAGGAGEVEMRSSGKLHDNSISQPPRWLNSGRDNGSVSDRDQHTKPSKCENRATARLDFGKSLPCIAVARFFLVRRFVPCSLCYKGWQPPLRSWDCRHQLNSRRANKGNGGILHDLLKRRRSRVRSSKCHLP